jgi:hypothetical protein
LPFGLGLDYAGRAHPARLFHPDYESTATDSPRHAFALVRSGQPERAVEALEAGRSVLLAEALERNRADLEHLRRSGHADLLDRYRTAVTAMQLAEREAPMPDDVAGILAHNAGACRPPNGCRPRSWRSATLKASRTPPLAMHGRRRCPAEPRSSRAPMDW